MLLKFSHTMIYSQQQIKSVQWYCEKLGFEIDYNAPGQYTSLHHKLLGRLAIHSTDSIQLADSAPMPYLLCDDIEKTIKELRSRGVNIGEHHRSGESPQFTHFKDLDGNIWGIEEN